MDEQYEVSPEQLSFYQKNGYLAIRDFLTPEEVSSLQRWTQEVHDLPRTPDSPWMPYEEINANGERVLCRTENYAGSHEGFNSLLRGSKLLSILKQLSGEDMLLFKEKINYKFKGSGGFAAHVDATAYTHIRDVKHLAILLAVDASNMRNGGLEVVEGSHDMDIKLGADNCVEKDWVARQKWVPVELEPGDVLIFGSYLAHRSAANTSDGDRRALYATYNRASEGDLHDEYYAHRAVHWPPTHKRLPEKDYSDGALLYGYGSPMLSVDLGRQLEV